MSREATLALKEKIKALAVKQRADKTLIRLPNNGRGSPGWNARVEAMKKATGHSYVYINPQWDIIRRAVHITAALNLYHELRGSPHRHNIRDPNFVLWHTAQLRRLREEIELECVST